MDQDDSTKAEQFQITLVGCSNHLHQGEGIIGLCLRVGCLQPSAQCCYCAQELHKDCHQFMQSLANIPELVIPLQQVRSKLFELQKNTNNYIEMLIISIDETLKPITQYTDNPNLVNLNELGKFLKQEIEATTTHELDIIEENIRSQFQQCKDNLLSRNFNEIDLDIFEIKMKKLFDENKAEQALTIIEAAKSKYRDNYCIQYLEGYALYMLQSYQAAIKCFDRAIEIDPNCLDAKIIRMNAIQEIDRIIEKKEKLGDSTNYKSYEHLVYVQEAIEFYDKLIQLNEKNSTAWFNKGSALFAMKKYIDSIDCFDKVLQIDPNCFDACKEKGYALYNIKRYSEAICQFEHALNLNPNHSTAIYGLEIAQNELEK